MVCENDRQSRSRPGDDLVLWEENTHAYGLSMYIRAHMQL